MPRSEAKYHWYHQLCSTAGGGLQLRLAVGDEVTAGGDKGLDALGPQGGDDVGGARAPVEAGEDGLVDLEGVHQGDDVERDGGLLRGAGSVPGQEAGAAVAAQVGNDDAVTLVGEERGYVDEAVDVVGPAVQEEDDRAVGGTGLGVADVQDPRLDLLERAELGVGARGDGGHGGDGSAARLVCGGRGGCAGLQAGQ